MQIPRLINLSLFYSGWPSEWKFIGGKSECLAGGGTKEPPPEHKEPKEEDLGHCLIHVNTIYLPLVPSATGVDTLVLEGVPSAGAIQ